MHTREQAKDARKRMRWYSAGMLVAVLATGCGEQTPPPGTAPLPPAPNAEQAPAAAAGPQSCNSSHVPKVVSIERWDNARLGQKDLLQRPESIAEDPATGNLYVANVNGVPSEKDGNGYITQIGVKAGALTVQAAKVIPVAGETLNGPKGTLVADGLLWTVDIDTVRVFDLSAKAIKQTRAFTIPQAQFGNDVAIAPDGRVFVTDTGLGATLQVPDPKAAAGECRVLTTATTGANGIVWNARLNKLVVAGTDFGGKKLGLYAVEPNGEKTAVANLTDGFGKLDGLVALPSGALLVSDWDAHAIWWVAADGQTREKVVDGFEGAADFCLCKDGQTLAVPDMPRNEIVLIRFEKPLE